ncbi:uncharacterized protein Dwil_GK18896 [Drosophila willistoni]|uniref:Non-structural maintenance of chromosomes element 1 homolog n=1 Tax=Drosophila willistoni TaxID=7260 RepID=B4MZ26_DROWI|nr:non-structural maintenance of chromosomes element 1 homolog [Drosophila willistoni]EDW77422.1 uncharacterized protein Dwil_GK18896 [Drosophila willistoni]
MEVKLGFLRACKNHSCLSHELIDQILTPLCEHHNVRKPSQLEDLKTFVKEIDESIGEYNQTLTFIKHPIKGKEYLVYAKTDATPDSAVGLSTMAAVEYQYFSILLDKIAQEDDCSIPWTGAYKDLGFEASAKPPKKNRLQVLLHKWCEMGYFLAEDDKIYLGPRSLVEFEFYLLTNHPGTIKKCVLCNNVVLWDIRCASCQEQIHRDCIHKYLQRRSHCPACNSLWTTPTRRSNS